MTTAKKKCTGCSRTFPATREFFHAHSSGKFGLQAACRKCQAAEKRAYYRSAKGKQAVRAYRAKNREAISARNRVLWANMSKDKREEGRRRASQWYRNNKDRARASHKDWLSKPQNRAKNKVYQKRYNARRARASRA